MTGNNGNQASPIAIKKMYIAMANGDSPYPNFNFARLWWINLHIFNN